MRLANKRSKAIKSKGEVEVFTGFEKNISNLKSHIIIQY